MPLAARAIAITALAAVALASSLASAQSMGTNQATSAPLSTDSAGKAANIAVSSVFRVMCHAKGNPSSNFTSFGTGFLHKSGLLVTAAHVSNGCDRIAISLPDGTLSPANVSFSDDRLDLSALKPITQITGTPLQVSHDVPLNLGEQIAIWGFPAGYIGRFPMVSVGYFSGGDAVPVKTANGVEMVSQMVVNAAVNHGNSGGPVVLVGTGEVIGIADNKIVPLSAEAVAALDALQTQSNGFMYQANMPDGSTKSFSEAQVVAMVLEELRQQVQLVVGHAVWSGDLRKFLEANKIDP